MKIILALFLITIIQAQDNLYDATRIYNAIIGLKSKYPEGTRWTNANSYSWSSSVAMGMGYMAYNGSGCAAFAMMASDAAFGNIPAYKKTDKAGIKIGDIIRDSHNSHSVIVLKVNGNNKYTIAEGNYAGTVHWGRVIDISQTGIGYRITRYKS